MKIAIIAEIPDGVAKDLMQHIRNFNAANPGCKFSMIANAPNMTKEQAAKILDVEPPLQKKTI